MALAIERLRRFTEDEYLTIERQADYKSEFLDGQMFAMAGGSREHSLICVSVVRELSQLLRGKGRYVFESNMRVKVSETGLYTYPDASIVCGEQRLGTVERDVLLNPTLVVEVLSPSTAEYDKGPKFDHYRTIESLREYLLVSQDSPRVERRLRQADGSWRTDIFEGLDARLYLESVGCELALVDVYDQVEVA